MVLLTLQNSVSIPSNRGKPSDPVGDGAPNFAKQCLNPLKSGQAFGQSAWCAACLSIFCLNPLKSGQAFGPLPDAMPVDGTRRLNPLKSGQAFGPIGPLFINRRQVIVSIPSNRGKPSDGKSGYRRCLEKACLNPLKSGQAFGPRVARHPGPLGTSLNPLKSGQAFGPRVARHPGPLGTSLNPLKSGQAFGPEIIARRLGCSLSLNPLKSGQAFGRRPIWTSSSFIAVSQSPQIGASLRTAFRPGWHGTLAPSQSPQIGASLRTEAAEPACLACGLVSIPSNRGKPSDIPAGRHHHYGIEVSIPSNRGKPSDQSKQQKKRRPATSQSPQIGASLRT